MVRNKEGGVISVSKGLNYRDMELSGRTELMGIFHIKWKNRMNGIGQRPNMVKWAKKPHNL